MNICARYASGFKLSGVEGSEMTLLILCDRAELSAYPLLDVFVSDPVLLYGVNEVSAMEPKLRELGIPFVHVGEYLEELLARIIS